MTSLFTYYFVGVTWLLQSSTSSAFQQQNNKICRYHVPKPPTTAPPLHLLHDNDEPSTTNAAEINLDMIHNKQANNQELSNPANAECLKYIQTIGQFCETMKYDTLEEYEGMMHHLQKSRQSYSRRPKTIVEHTKALDSLLTSFVQLEQQKVIKNEKKITTTSNHHQHQSFNYNGDIHKINKSRNGKNIMIDENLSYCMEFADDVHDKRNTATATDMVNRNPLPRVHPDMTVVDETRSSRRKQQQQQQHVRHVVHPDMTVVDHTRSHQERHYVHPDMTVVDKSRSELEVNKHLSNIQQKEKPDTNKNQNNNDQLNHQRFIEELMKFDPNEATNEMIFFADDA